MPSTTRDRSGLVHATRATADAKARRAAAAASDDTDAATDELRVAMAAPANEPGATPVRDPKATSPTGAGSNPTGKAARGPTQTTAQPSAQTSAQPSAKKPGAKPASGDTSPTARSRAKGSAPAKAPKEDARARGGGRKIILDEEFLVEGKLEKPNAFYILKRSQADYDWARLDAKFLPLVLESAQDPLF